MLSILANSWHKQDIAVDLADLKERIDKCYSVLIFKNYDSKKLNITEGTPCILLQYDNIN